MDEWGDGDPAPSVVSSVGGIAWLSPVSPDAECSCPVVAPSSVCPTGSVCAAGSVSVRVIVPRVEPSMVPSISMIQRVIFSLGHPPWLARGSERHSRPIFKFLFQCLFRPGKLNSQFIVTTFPVLHAGRQSLFRFQIQLSSRVYRKPQTTNCKKTTDHRAVPEQAGGSL